MSTGSALARATVAAALAAVPAHAFAHTGVGSTLGFVHGFGHPIGGIDHILAMVVVGIFAANIGARGLCAVPLTFMTLMMVGAAFGMAGMPLPFVEIGVALSIVVLGLMVAARFEWPIAAAMALVGLFAIFHGHAHGTEMPGDASGVSYALGFVLATGLLHLAGIALGLGIAQAGKGSLHWITQASGVAVAAAGVLILGGVI